MAVHTRLMVFALAATMVAGGSKARARARAHAPGTGGRRPLVKQTRRTQADPRPPQQLPAVISPCGRHRVRVDDGAVLLDGQPVHRVGEVVYLLAAPVFRRDGQALAWIERQAGQTRLVVVPDVRAPTALLTWALPLASPDDEIAWAGPRRVQVGAAMAPRAVATWTES